MARMLRRGWSLMAWATLAVAGMPPAWAAVPGRLMELTMQVQEHMQGMSALPAHTMTRQICLAEGVFDQRALAQLQAGSSCQVTRYDKQGDVVSFDAVCTAPQKVTSHGEFRLTGGADFTGTVQTAMDVAGHAVTVDTAYTGKAIGTCTPPASP